jgi:hypothetical protein
MLTSPSRLTSPSKPITFDDAEVATSAFAALATGMQVTIIDITIATATTRLKTRVRKFAIKFSSLNSKISTEHCHSVIILIIELFL